MDFDIPVIQSAFFSFFVIINLFEREDQRKGCERERANKIICWFSPQMARTGPSQRWDPETESQVSHKGGRKAIGPSPLPPKICLSMKLESGIGARNQTQALHYGIQEP